jgi:hypothetical protein
MKKIIFLIFLLSIFYNLSKAQNIQTGVKVEQYAAKTFETNIAKDFDFGSYEHKELDMASYEKDPDAHAVVLKEYGKTTITSNGNNVSLSFFYHVRIKIFDSKAFDKGYIDLPYYIKDNGSYEEIRPSGIRAITLYEDKDGLTKSAVVNPDSIHYVKINKHWSSVRFTMPHVQSGCIIEYKYELESPYIDKLRTWDFQSDIPKISSEYEVHIPQVFGYNVSLRGALKLTKDTIAIEKDCFESPGLESDCNVEDYEMTDIPAFKAEPYMSATKNFMSALYFQQTDNTRLEKFTVFNHAWDENIGRGWTDADKLLKFDENFGSQLGRKSIFKSLITNIESNYSDTLDRAKAIYTYIQKNIAFDSLYNIYADEGIKKALDKHTGNVADINLALVTALNAAGIDASAVITSTQNNGIVIKAYPALTEFNYVIVATNIEGKTYLLDATDPLLPFGMLPSRALNDQGRVISLDNPSYWINITTPQKNINTYLLDLTMDEQGIINGTITHYSRSYAAYEKRLELKKYKSTNDYIKSQIDSSDGMHIIKYEISNQDSLDMPLAEVYNVKIDNKNGGFNPLIYGKWNNNPFTANTRDYPVNFGMPYLYNFTLTLNLPANITVTNSPENLSAIMPDNGGKLTATYENNNNVISYSDVYSINKPAYSVKQYPALKDFFDKIILFEKTPVTFKK